MDTIRMLAFDVDGTLSEPDKSIAGDVSSRLRALEEKGVKILLISGKSAPYLAGLARGLGIADPLVAGENGCVILEPLKLSEKRLASRNDTIVRIGEQVCLKFADSIWLQHNQVSFTVFPKEREMIDEIYHFILDSLGDQNGEVDVLKHIDAIDVMPPDVNKGLALAEIKDKFDFIRTEVIAIGDSHSDLSMASEVREILLIGDKVSCEGARYFPTIDKALSYLEDII